MKFVLFLALFMLGTAWGRFLGNIFGVDWVIFFIYLFLALISFLVYFILELKSNSKRRKK